MKWVYLWGPALGILVGAIFGQMTGSGMFHAMRGSGIGSRVGGGSGWTVGYMVLGAL